MKIFFRLTGNKMTRTKVTAIILLFILFINLIPIFTKQADASNIWNGHGSVIGNQANTTYKCSDADGFKILHPDWYIKSYTVKGEGSYGDRMNAMGMYTHNLSNFYWNTTSAFILTFTELPKTFITNSNAIKGLRLEMRTSATEGIRRLYFESITISNGTSDIVIKPGGYTEDQEPGDPPEPGEGPQEDPAEMILPTIEYEYVTLTINHAGTGNGTTKSADKKNNLYFQHIGTKTVKKNSTYIAVAEPSGTSWFEGWSGDTISAQGEIEIFMNEDKTIVANFAQEGMPEVQDPELPVYEPEDPEFPEQEPLEVYINLQRYGPGSENLSRVIHQNSIYVDWGMNYFTSDPFIAHQLIIEFLDDNLPEGIEIKSITHSIQGQNISFYGQSQNIYIYDILGGAQGTLDIIVETGYISGYEPPATEYFHLVLEKIGPGTSGVVFDGEESGSGWGWHYNLPVGFYMINALPSYGTQIVKWDKKINSGSYQEYSTSPNVIIFGMNQGDIVYMRLTTDLEGGTPPPQPDGMTIELCLHTDSTGYGTFNWPYGVHTVAVNNYTFTATPDSASTFVGFVTSGDSTITTSGNKAFITNAADGDFNKISVIFEAKTGVIEAPENPPDQDEILEDVRDSLIDIFIKLLLMNQEILHILKQLKITFRRLLTK